MKKLVFIVALMLPIVGFAKGWLPPQAKEVQSIIQEANDLGAQLKSGALEKQCRQRMQHECRGFGPMQGMCKMMQKFFGKKGGFWQYRRAIEKYVQCVHKAVKMHNVPQGVLQCQRVKPELDCSKWMQRHRGLHQGHH